MNANFARAGLAALALGSAVPAYAGVSEDFSECDGLKKPKSSDDGMRGEATFPSYRFGGRDAPSQTLAAKIAASNHQHPDHDTDGWPHGA